MTELDYVRSNAREDRQARHDAIVKLRAVEAENSRLFHEVSALRKRVAELEKQVSSSR